jgi:ABC-type oligopeptide transport system substrate-binding subunit/DNA-binding SARP family transcriptional activator
MVREGVLKLDKSSRFIFQVWGMIIKISVLGPVQLFLGGKQFRLRTLKGQALLYYLLVEALEDPGRGRSRESLMELLWPGMPLKSAQENLRQAVYQLRKCLAEAGYDGPPALLSDRQTIGLNPEFACELDVERFFRLLSGKAGEDPTSEAERLLEASGCYRGDFLADFFLPDSASFEDWATARREQFRRMALGLFNRLAEIYLEAGSFNQAREYARRQVEIDPFYEDAHRQLLLALFQQGERAGAINHYEYYRRKLQSELGVEPGTELRALVEQIKSETSPQQAGRLKDKQEPPHLPQPIQARKSAAAVREKAHFWGRANQLRGLHQHLDSVLENQAHVAVITGEAGAGKTALMEEFARQAQGRVPRLLAAKGACNAFTGVGDAYLPFRDVLEGLGQAQTWQNGAPLSRSASNQELLFEQFTRTLLEKAERNPLLIVLDDLQWADTASIRLLFHLGRRMANSPIFILGAYRPSEVKLGSGGAPGEPDARQVLKQVVNELKRQYGDIELDLDIFSPAEARAFMEAYLDQDPSISPNRFSEKFRTQLFWRTKGQPLFTIELIQEMQARGDLVRSSDGRWTEGPELNWDLLPARIEAVIQQRIQRLETELHEILSAACVEGEEFTAQVAARVAGFDERKVLRLLTHELEHRHGLVRGQGELRLGQIRLDRFAFSHALFQQYLYHELNPGERRLLHSEIARLLEEISQASNRDLSVKLAHHFDQAGLGEKAAGYLLQAGDQARTLYAHEEAVRHYRRAIHIMKERGDTVSAASALMKLGLTYHIAFDFEAARQAYQEGFLLRQERRGDQIVTQLPPAPHPLRLRWGDPPSLDPTLGGLSYTAPIVTQLFSGLVATNPDMEVVPDVAIDWELLEGGRKYVFHLRQDVFWSDGKQVTAGDFEYAFKRALNPATNSPVASLLLYDVCGARDYHQGKHEDAGEVGIYCLDDFTLVIEMEEPVSYFLQQLSYYVLLPVPRHVVEQYGAAWAEPNNIITNGPFRLAEWKKGEIMRLQRSSTYHARFEGNLEQVELALGLSSEQEFGRYQADTIDLVTNWFTSSELFESMARKNPADYSMGKEFVTMYLIIDPAQAPFTDKRVRQAFVYSINREYMAEVFFKNAMIPALGGFVPPGMPGYAEGAGLAYQPEKACRLLAEAGFPEGKGFKTGDLIVYHSRQSLAEYLINEWLEKLNVHVPLAVVEAINFMDYFMKKRPPLAVAGWWADYADPENFLRVCVNMDLPDWHDPRYEGLLDKARHTFQQAERVEIYQEADRLLMEEAVLVPLLYGQKHLVKKPWVKNYRTMAIKHPGFWKDVVIEPHG